MSVSGFVMAFNVSTFTAALLVELIAGRTNTYFSLPSHWKIQFSHHFRIMLCTCAPQRAHVSAPFLSPGDLSLKRRLWNYFKRFHHPDGSISQVWCTIQNTVPDLSDLTSPFSFIQTMKFSLSGRKRCMNLHCKAVSVGFGQLDRQCGLTGGTNTRDPHPGPQSSHPASNQT